MNVTNEDNHLVNKIPAVLSNSSFVLR